MRIIGGKFRGKLLSAADETVTRPTADRAKEGIFNILESWLMKAQYRWADCVFVDVFAGSGAMGIEALSRGAKRAVFFENNPMARKFLTRNLNGLKDVIFQIEKEALRPPETKEPARILFLDPPYHQGLCEKVLPLFYQAGWIDNETLVIAEIDNNENLAVPDFLTCFRQVHYGRNHFVFMRLQPSENDEI